MSEVAVDTRALVDRAQQGDREAFGQLYAAYYGLVWSYIQRRVVDRHLVEDLAADTFERALRSISRYTWTGGGFGAWLTTIARNLIADHYKSSRVWMSRPVDIDDATWSLPDSDRRGDPEHVATVNAGIEDLDEALRLLTGPQRRVLALRYGSGMSVAETAAAMGCEVGAATAAQHRATASLRRHLAGVAA